MSEYLTIWLKLLAASLLFIPSIIYHIKGEDKKALRFLIMAAAFLRIVMITLDPFLHEWDERYHALVAKHLIDHPIIPLLREHPVLAYDYKAWCCNHVWLHKQPLFMWQMALSMHLFGVNVFWLRFPDVIMGMIAVCFVYRIAFIWTSSVHVAWLTALLYASAHFFLELTAGSYALDHNDLAFFFYVSGALWAFCEYTKHSSWKFAVLTGFFVGAAILVKWLTGLLPLGGWLLYTVLNRKERKQWSAYLHFLLALLISIIIFLPWQLYISKAFPLEASWEYEHNIRHFSESFSAEKNAFFHINFMDMMYGGAFLVFIPFGIWKAYRKIENRALTLSIFAMVLVVYVLFSVFVATKMGGYTIPVPAFLFSIIALGLDQVITWSGIKTSGRIKSFYPVLLYAVVLISMKPWSILSGRKASNEHRQAKIHNTEIYKNLNKQLSADVVIINCKEMEDVELMFWQPNNAYQWFPTPDEVQDLLQKGYKVAAFKDHTQQHLPQFIKNNPAIQIIDLELK